ncbi:hypothetical protein TUBRATIS_16990 [Tubulinosema ratisbonensis]|uniref:Uncharacterized protein n=1 Tax=Tubulinosema ratisbonensis TaxID=291195 RepID=A0A437AL27_9MICR|nr:hypothetical protein TUBRATIS_16990 [Tubulinosema ratisbonensis]
MYILLKCLIIFKASIPPFITSTIDSNNYSADSAYTNSPNACNQTLPYINQRNSYIIYSLQPLVIDNNTQPLSQITYHDSNQTNHENTFTQSQQTLSEVNPPMSTMSLNNTIPQQEEFLQNNSLPFYNSKNFCRVNPQELNAESSKSYSNKSKNPTNSNYTPRDSSSHYQNATFALFSREHFYDIKIKKSKYNIKFNLRLDRKEVFERNKEIIRKEILYHKNFNVLQYIDQILELVFRSFGNDFKNASLFIIFISYFRRGFRRYVNRDRFDFVDHLFYKNLSYSPFSNRALINTIFIWKTFKFDFSTIKEGYDILVVLGDYYIFNIHRQNIDSYIFSYKKFAFLALEYLFNDQVDTK